MKYHDGCLAGKPDDDEKGNRHDCRETGASEAATAHLDVRGKFLFLGENKLYLKGLWLASEEQFSSEIPELGVNVIWLSDPSLDRLDFFQNIGLRVVASLGLEKCLLALFAEEKNAEQKWLDYVERLIPQILAHPALLAYELGAAVSEPMLKDMGKTSIERLIRRAFRKVKTLDPGRPVTCTSDFRFAGLDLSFLDFYSYKLSDLSLTEIRMQLSRLQTMSADKALVVHLPGFDSIYQGQEEHAFLLDQQIHMAFIAGCAGVAFAAGIRHDKGAAGQFPGCLDPTEYRKKTFEAVKASFQECPFPSYLPYPRMSVVICVYNGEDYIEECLDGCSRLDYPNFEVIVVNDGSTDGTLALAEAKALKYGFKVISQMPNAGLSAARNLGMRCANGEIIAYLDSDAFPDKDWLRYLAITFLSYKYAIVGGPNINPLSGGALIDCIDKAPGNSQVVMLDDELADHIPGCNLAVRREFMQTIGGFDDSYRAGGDDVTFCWRVIKAGGTLGVSPGAMVWHYRRPTIAAYFKQQRGYGKGEAVLERDYPERFNSLGHQVSASSRSQEKGASPIQMSPSPIYQALRGGESFLQLWFSVFPTMPEWLIMMAIFALLSLCGLFWKPFLIFVPILLAGLIVWLAAPVRAGLRANLRFPSLKSRSIVAFLHLAQPLVRLQGRFASGMTPWRSRCKSGFVFPKRMIVRLALHDDGLQKDSQKTLQNTIRALSLPAVQGASAHSWDWQIEGGIFGGVRVLSNADARELKLKVSPYAGTMTWMLISISAAVAALAVSAQAWPVLALVAIFVALLAYCSVRQAGEALAALQPVLSRENFAGRSFWDRFQPPRHFFEDSLYPGQRAIAFARDFAETNEVARSLSPAHWNCRSAGSDVHDGLHY